eukprot:scaffold2815_cov113-Isochrysis_galbana.AAC.3
MLPGVAKVAARMSDWSGPHLLQVRHQIVGDAAGILSDATGRVRADGIKVAEQADVQLRMGLRAVAGDRSNGCGRGQRIMHALSNHVWRKLRHGAGGHRLRRGNRHAGCEDRTVRVGARADRERFVDGD